jgi:hypothetical protein
MYGGLVCRFATLVSLSEGSECPVRMFAGFSLHGFKPQIASTEGKTSGMSAVPALAHVHL